MKSKDFFYYLFNSCFKQQNFNLIMYILLLCNFLQYETSNIYKDIAYSTFYCLHYLFLN